MQCDQCSVTDDVPYINPLISLVSGTRIIIRSVNFILLIITFVRIYKPNS
jgi:hypothetical protein